jgi:hypothetical protein
MSILFSTPTSFVTQKFYIIMNEADQIADIDPVGDGFRWENPGWNMKYYYWFTEEESLAVMDYLVQSGSLIRRVLVPAALVAKFTDFSALL